MPNRSAAPGPTTDHLVDLCTTSRALLPVGELEHGDVIHFATRRQGRSREGLEQANRVIEEQKWEGKKEQRNFRIEYEVQNGG